MMKSVIIRGGGACTTHGREVLRSFVEKPVGGRSFGRHGRRWKDNIKKKILKKWD
jgi:hypothetical protein